MRKALRLKAGQEFVLTDAQHKIPLRLDELQQGWRVLATYTDAPPPPAARPRHTRRRTVLGSWG